MKCDNCRFKRIEGLSVTLFPIFYCSIGHWENGDDLREYQGDNELWDDCDDFKKKKYDEN
jgi:hypothetical protein